MGPTIRSRSAARPQSRAVGCSTHPRPAVDFHSHAESPASTTGDIRWRAIASPSRIGGHPRLVGWRLLRSRHCARVPDLSIHQPMVAAAALQQHQRDAGPMTSVWNEAIPQNSPSTRGSASTRERSARERRGQARHGSRWTDSSAGIKEQAHPQVARPHPKRQARGHDFAAIAGWRPAFDNPQHRGTDPPDPQRTATGSARSAASISSTGNAPTAPSVRGSSTPQTHLPRCAPKPGYTALLASATGARDRRRHPLLALNVFIAGLVLPIVFAVQLFATWKLITHLTNPGFSKLNAEKRRPHWHAAIGSVAMGVIGAVGAFCTGRW